LEVWDEDDKNQNSPKCDRLGSAQVPWLTLWQDVTANGEAPKEQALYLKVFEREREREREGGVHENVPLVACYLACLPRKRFAEKMLTTIEDLDFDLF
jgi:hypothetical protein